MDINSTLLSSIENSLESEVRKSLKETYKNEKPSKRVLSTIMGYAASYDCVDTRLGKVEMMFN